MSWHLLIPVAERIIEAGIKYYTSESGNPQSATAEPLAINSTSNTSASVLLAVEYPGSEEELRAKLEEALGLVDNLQVTAMEVKKDEKDAPG